MRFAVPAVFALIVASVLAVAALWSVNAAERAYPISAVQAGMGRDPGAWTTHPLLVRGAIMRWLSTPNSCGGRAPGLDTCSPTETLWAQVGTARSHLNHHGPTRHAPCGRADAGTVIPRLCLACYRPYHHAVFPSAERGRRYPPCCLGA